MCSGGLRDWSWRYPVKEMKALVIDYWICGFFFGIFALLVPWPLATDPGLRCKRCNARKLVLPLRPYVQQSHE